MELWVGKKLEEEKDGTFATYSIKMHLRVVTIFPTFANNNLCKILGDDNQKLALLMKSIQGPMMIQIYGKKWCPSPKNEK